MSGCPHALLPAGPSQKKKKKIHATDITENPVIQVKVTDAVYIIVGTAETGSEKAWAANGMATAWIYRGMESD